MDDPGEPSYTGFFLLAGTFDLGLIFSGLLLLLLLFLSAMISGSEVAFFSLSPSHRKDLEEVGTRNARLILQLLERTKELLATILITNNFVNVAIILLASTLSNSIFSFSDGVLWGFAYSASSLEFLINVGVITFLILLFGEVIPKVYASRYPVRLATLMATPTFVALRFFKQLGLVPLLVRSSRFLDRTVKKRNTNLSVDQLSHALEITDTREIREEDQKMLEGIVRFGNVEVKQIMKPRVDVVAFDVETPYAEMLQKVLKSGFSRIPIYEERFDQIKGILYLKDLLPYIDQTEPVDWHGLLREPFYVPENKKIDDLLNEFRDRKMHLAIVVDEYGGSQGIVTLEDVIEEIVGEISDEFDEEDLVYSKLDDRNYVFEGKTSLNDVCKVLDLDDQAFDDVKGESETLAGMVLELAGRIPKKNEKIKIPGYTFTIDAADRKRVRRIKLSLDPEDDAPENSRKTRDYAGAWLPWLFLVAALSFLASCEEEYLPKPRAYHRIDFPEPQYQMTDWDCPFSFPYSQEARIDYARISKEKTCWFNLYYPRYRSRIHFTYFDEHVRDSLSKYTENSHQLVTKHVVKAQDILENRVLDDSARVFGVTYDFIGGTASNFQFFLTDSTDHFLHASMYFEMPPNPDSLQPVEAYIKRDLYRLIDGFQWKPAP